MIDIPRTALAEVLADAGRDRRWLGVLCDALAESGYPCPGDLTLLRLSARPGPLRRGQERSLAKKLRRVGRWLAGETAGE